MRASRPVPIIAAVVFALGLGAAAHAGLADEGDFVDADRIVAGHPGVTYVDLIRQAVPDLAMSDADGKYEGHLGKPPPRHLAGKDYEGDSPDTLTLGLIEDQRIVAGGRRRIAVLADFGGDPDRAQSFTLLMLFDDAPTPKLLDAADVGVDLDTSFSDAAVLKLGPGDDALVTYSDHFNTSETYSNWLIVFARSDRWRLVDQLFAPSERGCDWLERQTPTITTRPDSGRPYWRIDVVVTDVGKRQGEDCGDEKVPKPFSRTWRGSYRWDATADRFEDPTGAVARETQHNFDRIRSGQ